MTITEISKGVAKTKRGKSEHIYKASCQVIPGGVNSPVRAFSSLGLVPLVASSGYQDTLLDVDGNRFIDFCGSWGALIHGHAHPLIVEAAQRKMALGSSFGVATESEVKLASKVCELVHSCEKVRFVSSGTEATMSAVRLARGFTKRDLVVKFNGHYHGHADPFLTQSGSGLVNLSPTSSSAGVPSDYVKHTLSLPFNNVEVLKRTLKDPILKSQIAAIILEPIAANMGVVLPEETFLKVLREESQKIGALLIFDEVITGFRVSQQGAQGFFGITPDLTTFGKIVGGGFPAAAFGGRADVMDALAPLGPVYQAGTLSGNPVAMEAGWQALHLLEKPNFYQVLAEKTALIVEPIEELIRVKKLNATISHATGLFTLFLGQREVTDFDEVKKCNPRLFKKLFQFAFERGVYFSPSQFEANFISAAHTKAHLLLARDILLEFLETTDLT